MINEAILEVLDLLHSEVLKHKVAVRMQLADGLPPVQGDRVALQQVVLNLICSVETLWRLARWACSGRFAAGGAGCEP